jgi:hypothetical protein
MWRMAVSRVSKWRAAIRDTTLGSRLAIALWIVWAFAVWNVVFDRVLVLAGRRYVHAAAVSAGQSNAFIRIADWMRPAVWRGFWAATAAGTLILVTGLVAVGVAARRRRALTSSESPRRS